MYKFYSVVNLAETWRDSDQYQYSEEKYFSSFEKLCNYVIPYLNDKIKNNEEKITEIKLNKNNKWYYSFFGSWAPTYCIEKIEVDETYEEKAKEYEMNKKEFYKWCKELKLLD